ncbi:MAG: hypothetical protein D6707_10935 [Bacteroidetes bacterium]|nr:MAG: hypothetical protein D6707_10935 [Bacteroidota bacterium]
MKVDLFHKVLKNHSAIYDVPKSYWNDLIAKYPYFQAAYYLYAKKLFEEHDDEYPAFLKQASLHAPDRRQLYKWIIQTQIRQKIEQVEKEIEQTLQEEKITVPEVTPKEKKQHIDELEALILENLVGQIPMLPKVSPEEQEIQQDKEKKKSADETQETPHKQQENTAK